MGHRVIVRVDDDWVEVRPGQVWTGRGPDGQWENFKVVSVSSDRANVRWIDRSVYRRFGTKRLSAFRSCELIEDVEKEAGK